MPERNFPERGQRTGAAARHLLDSCRSTPSTTASLDAVAGPAPLRLISLQSVFRPHRCPDRAGSKAAKGFVRRRESAATPCDCRAIKSEAAVERRLPALCRSRNRLAQGALLRPRNPAARPLAITRWKQASRLVLVRPGALKLGDPVVLLADWSGVDGLRVRLPVETAWPPRQTVRRSGRAAGESTTGPWVQAWRRGSPGRSMGAAVSNWRYTDPPPEPPVGGRWG